jgi:hypothetical protein
MARSAGRGWVGAGARNGGGAPGWIVVAWQVCAGTTEYDGPRPSPPRHLPTARGEAKRRPSREPPSGRGEQDW